MTRNHNKKPTIKDIANKAKVSKSTVSRVINNSHSVNEKKRKAVLAAMANCCCGSIRHLNLLFVLGFSTPKKRLRQETPAKRN